MNTLGIFARLPDAGKTKTRLAAAIGDTVTAELYACFVQDIIDRFETFCDRVRIAVTPATEESRSWFERLLIGTFARNGDSDCRVILQPGGDLGARIEWFFCEQAGQGSGATVLIGTDSPDLPIQLVQAAFETLNADAADVVLVPACDGGFVLIGIQGQPQTIVRDIRWSSPHTLIDTIAAAVAAGRRTELLPPWYDVDTVENLGTLAALQQHAGQTQAASCPRTWHWLQRRLPEFTGR